MNEQARLRGSSTITSKGQTTVPKPVRDALGIKDGTRLEWLLEDGVLKVRAKTLNIADFAGMLGRPPSGAGLAVEDMDEAIAAAAVERFERASKP